MKRQRQDEATEAAFTLGDDDRFYAILASDGVRYETDPDAETVITFFVIRRSSGRFDIVNIYKTFKGRECVSRTVQTKQGIPAGRIEAEVTAIEQVFSESIEESTGYRIKWYRLDLARVEDRATQIAAIAYWGRVGVKVEPGGGITETECPRI